MRNEMGMERPDVVVTNGMTSCRWSRRRPGTNFLNIFGGCKNNQIRQKIPSSLPASLPPLPSPHTQRQATDLKSHRKAIKETRSADRIWIGSNTGSEFQARPRVSGVDQ